MLAMSGIEATFVIAMNEQGSISISARSEAKSTCKKLWSKWEAEATLIRRLLRLEDVTIDQVRTQLIDCIQEEVQKDKEEEE